MYGDSMQSMVPQYLEASMEAFRKNQMQFQEAMKGAFGGGPLAEIAKRNMQMFEAAASAFGGVPGIPGMPGASSAQAPAAATPDDGKDDEIADLKAQLAALNAKIDKLS
jgi:polyhydroxyalkanoate synthesis regulator protein